MRQIVLARNAPGLPLEQRQLLDGTLERERGEMRTLFGVVEDALVGVAEGSVDAMAESKDQDESGERMLRAWGGRWLRVFRRKMAVEEAWVGEMLEAGLKGEEVEMTVDDVLEDGGEGADGFGDGAVANGEEGLDDIS